MALEHQSGTQGARARTMSLLYVSNLDHFQTKVRKEIKVWCQLTPALEFALRMKSPQKKPQLHRQVQGHPLDNISYTSQSGSKTMPIQKAHYKVSTLGFSTQITFFPQRII